MDPFLAKTSMNARLCSAWLPGSHHYHITSGGNGGCPFFGHGFALLYRQQTHTLFSEHSFEQPRGLLPSLVRPALFFHGRQPHAFLCLLSLLLCCYFLIVGVATVDKAGGGRSHCSPLSSHSLPLRLSSPPNSSLSDSFLLPLFLPFSTVIFLHSL